MLEVRGTARTPLTPSWLGMMIMSAGSLVSCGAGNDQAGVQLAVDSAGTEIVILELSLDVLGASFRTAPQPDLELGVALGQSELELSEVLGALRLDDGRFVVGNGGTNELRFYDPNGAFAFALGGDGEGPGEFRSLDYLGLIGSDSILVHDRRLQRLSLFDTKGSFLASRGPSGPHAATLPWVVGRLENGTLVTWSHVGEEGEELGVYAPSFSVGFSSTWRDGSVRVIATGRGSEEARVEYNGRITRAFRPFGREADVAASREYVYVLSSTDDTSIEVYDLTGRLRRILRIRLPRQPTTAEVTSVWMDSWIARYANGSPDLEAWWRHGFEETPAPEFVPMFRSLEVDVDGNVCAERYPLTMDPSPEYWCFSSDGNFRRRIVMPAGLLRLGPHPFFAPQLSIGRDHVLGVWQDSLDIQYVRHYRLAQR